MATSFTRKTRSKPEMLNILATFTTPETITVTPYTFLWALPLLLCISITVKAIKPEVLNIPKLAKDSLKLFAGSVLVLIAIAVVLGALLEFVN